MLGDKVKTLYGTAKTQSREIPVEDTAAIMMQMEKGTICVIEGATTAYPGFTTSFGIYGELGSIEFDDTGIKTWNFIDADHAPARPDAGDEQVGGAKNPVDIGIYGHIGLLRDIAEAVRDDRQPMIPPTEADLAVKVICATYESAKTEMPIKF